MFMTVPSTTIISCVADIHPSAHQRAVGAFLLDIA